MKYNKENFDILEQKSWKVFFRYAFLETDKQLATDQDNICYCYDIERYYNGGSCIEYKFLIWLHFSLYNLIILSM